MGQSKPTYRITDMAESERPRERLARLGAQALNTAELLAILLRVGVKGENAVQVGQRILNGILKFSHVSRPIVGHKNRFGFGRKSDLFAKELLTVARQEMFG